MLLLHVELPIRAAFFFNMERREARRTDSCVMLCRKPAREWRSLREHRTELRREVRAVSAIAILAAVRPGEGFGLLASSADKRSAAEILTTTSEDTISAGDGAVLHVSSTSSSSTCSGFLLHASWVSKLLGGDWLTSSATSGFVCLFFRVERFGCALVLVSEVEASGMALSSAMKFRDLTEEPRRLLRFPFENLYGKGK